MKYKPIMKKPTYLLLALFAIVCGALASCSDSKTYAEQLSDERKAIRQYVKDNGINAITVEDFEEDTITDVSKNEYVCFSSGVYMQIVKRYDNEKYSSFEEAPAFESNNQILARFVEVDIMENDTTLASNVCNAYEYLNLYPEGFRYTISGTKSYGQFLAEPGLAYYLGYGMGGMYGTSVPAGWLEALPYVHDGAHVKLIVPSKSGHDTAVSYVYPYFYDIRKFSIY
jgi:predicted ATPase